MDNLIQKILSNLEKFENDEKIKSLIEIINKKNVTNDNLYNLAYDLDQHIASSFNYNLKKLNNINLNITEYLYSRDKSLKNIHLLATISLHMGKIKQAIKFYNHANKLFSYPGYNIDLANSYRQLGENKKAIKYYEIFIKENPNNWIGYYNLAQIYKEQGKINICTNNAKISLDLLPKNLKINKQLIKNLEEIIKNSK